MRGHVQEVEPGKFRIYAPAGRDPLTGKRRTVSQTVNGNHSHAEKTLARLIVSIDEGRSGQAPTTVGALMDRWLAHIEGRRSPLTMRGYRSKVETHIRPALGDLPLRKLTPAKLDEFYRDLQDRGRKPHGAEPKDPAKRARRAGIGPRPMSAQSVRHVHSVIHAACEQALRWEWLDRNPAHLADPPPIEHLKKPAPTIGDVLAALELLTVDMRELAVMAIVTSARRGELCGLQWPDLRGDDLTISRAIADVSAKAWVVKAPKTNQVRRLAIDAVTVEMLISRRVRMAEKALACGVSLERNAYMFADVPGGETPTRPALVTKRWSNAAARAGVRCRFHDLRHFSITELLEAGFEIGGVSERAGHARTSITQDLYQHSRRSGDRAAAEHLSRLLRPAT